MVTLESFKIDLRTGRGGVGVRVGGCAGKREGPATGGGVGGRAGKREGPALGTSTGLEFKLLGLNGALPIYSVTAPCPFTKSLAFGPLLFGSAGSPEGVRVPLPVVRPEEFRVSLARFVTTDKGARCKSDPDASVLRRFLST